MVKTLFRASVNRAVIRDLHGKIVAAARQPALYADYGVPDTLEGRFELVTLHAMIALRALRSAPEPGPQMAQDISNAVFADFDAALREMGVGDASIPKRISKLAGDFVGRCAAYEAALAVPGNSALTAALERNIFAPGGGDAARLARYVRAAAATFAALSLDQMSGNSLAFAAAQDIA